ncbi:RnfABCDGE type electron transport complex subunit D [Buchnera aphidicola]
MCFSILIAKQLYGGLGQNLFNPDMVGDVFYEYYLLLL